jgi:hypothetical protein
LRNPRLDADYTTGGDYRLEQGFDDNAHTQEARDGAEFSLSQPQPTQFGLYSDVNVRPAPYTAISDPGIHTLGSIPTSAMPIGREYPNPATTAGYYSSPSITSVTNEMNNLGLQGQASYPPMSGSECKYAHSHQNRFIKLAAVRRGSYSGPPHSYRAGTDIAEDNEIPGGNDADAADVEDDEDYIEQDDRDEQYPNESNVLDDDLDEDDELYLQDRRTSQSVPVSSKQPKKISKEDIFTTKDPKIRKQALYKGVLSIP